jgi:hypothetical protein
MESYSYRNLIAGYRGPACELQECPSGADPLDGYGNESGRDCSGRGLCDYNLGLDNIQ